MTPLTCGRTSATRRAATRPGSSVVTGTDCTSRVTTDTLGGEGDAEVEAGLWPQPNRASAGTSASCSGIPNAIVFIVDPCRNTLHNSSLATRPPAPMVCVITPPAMAQGRCSGSRRDADPLPSRDGPVLRSIDVQPTFCKQRRLAVFGVHEHDEVRVRNEQCRLAICIATIGAMRVSLDKFPNREAVCSRARRDRGTRTHKLFSNVSGTSIQSFQYGPRFKKRADAERSELTADTRMLESAERRLLIV